MLLFLLSSHFCASSENTSLSKVSLVFETESSREKDDLINGPRNIRKEEISEIVVSVNSCFIYISIVILLNNIIKLTILSENPHIIWRSYPERISLLLFTTSSAK